MCNEGQLNLNFFGVTLGTSTDINQIKFILIKLQLACAAIMIAICITYIVIYIYTWVMFHTNNRVTDPHATIELGRIQAPPSPYWPPPPRELPPSSEF